MDNHVCQVDADNEELKKENEKLRQDLADEEMARRDLYEENQELKKEIKTTYEKGLVVLAKTEFDRLHKEIKDSDEYCKIHRDATHTLAKDNMKLKKENEELKQKLEKQETSGWFVTIKDLEDENRRLKQAFDKQLDAYNKLHHQHEASVKLCESFSNKIWGGKV